MTYTYLITIYHGPGHQSKTRFMRFYDRLLTRKDKRLESEIFAEEYEWPIVKFQVADSATARRNKAINTAVANARINLIEHIKSLMMTADGLGMSQTRHALSELINQARIEEVTLNGARL